MPASREHSSNWMYSGHLLLRQQNVQLMRKHGLNTYTEEEWSGNVQKKGEWMGKTS